MRKILSKYIYLVGCTFVLAVIVLYGFSTYESEICAFHIESDSETVEIVPFEAEDGTYYVFLPSYCEMEDVSVDVITYQTVKIDDKQIEDGSSLEWIELEKTYSFTVDEQVFQIEFWKSANVATMYINTLSGDMEHVDEDKENEERAEMLLYTENGIIDFADTSCSIKTRGNGTWWYDKKPYLLSLEADGELLGMEAATKWVLLSNATDETNLRNKLVYHLANQLDFAWTPDCVYVDLYLNGKYNGLYLLAEKVESGENRVNIDTERGDFLCKIDLVDRWDTLDNPFLTEYGRTVDICSSEIVMKEEQNRIEQLVNQLEQEILAKPESYTQMNLDSWVRRYLIDEISGNIDSDLASSYFYYKDNMFYAGPLWDYDMTFGNSSRNQDPCAFIAKNAYKESNLHSPYYNALYHNPAFYQRMVELYQIEFLPLLEQLVDVDIKKMADEIADAAQMNSVRWNAMFQELYAQNNVIETTVDSLIQYVQARVEFLNAEWIEKDGLPTDEEIIALQQSTEKGNVSTQQTDTLSEISTRDVITVFSMIVLVFMFLCLLIMDIRRRRKERNIQ